MKRKERKKRKVEKEIKTHWTGKKKMADEEGKEDDEQELPPSPFQGMASSLLLTLKKIKKKRKDKKRKEKKRKERKRKEKKRTKRRNKLIKKNL